MTNKYAFIIWFTILPALLSGCASISRGVTQAILDREVEDVRQCVITGREFGGLENLFETEAAQAAETGKPAKLKILKVHGIGEHAPGYSARLLDGLVRELGFAQVDETVKTIHMNNPQYPDGLGILRIYRYMNPQRAREMLYYELTWDPIVEEEKQLLAFDNTALASLLRTDFNHDLKTLINATLPDAIMYNSRFRIPIQQSVGQAICWMLSTTWEDLPDNRVSTCGSDSGTYWSEFDASSIAIISHSMGSRISIDALQSGVAAMSQRPDSQDFVEDARAEPIYLFMLSNQLPLLQLGQPLPEVHDQVRSYCRAESDNYDRRYFKNLQVVAFSDPNDLFSYAVTPKYIHRYVDSRLCPSVTNVQIQVAPVTSILGLREVANPETAHVDYEIDSRVIRMLVSGFGKTHGHEEVKTRCEFIETIPDY